MACELLENLFYSQRMKLSPPIFHVTLAPMSDRSGGRFSILFVEDDHVQAELIEIACSKAGDGIECNFSSDVEHAKSFLQTNLPDLIIADMNLGCETGLDLLKWLKSSSAGKDIPFYIWTYRPPASLQHEVTNLGGQGVLDRFPNFPELCQGIRNLKRKHA